jgi:predicted nucleic acid-binding protein
LSIYLDASFLVSLYSIDANSSKAAKTLQSVEASTVPWVSALGELEVVNALGLRLFRKQDSAAEIRLALNAFDDDLGTGRFQLRQLPDLVFRRARQVSLQTTARLGTRASDVLHVAAALELGAEEFYSFDKQQRKLAELMKLRIGPRF